MRIRLANSATAIKKQTTITGISISTQATGSRPPKQSAWKIPVPNKPTIIHQTTADQAPTAA
jgi:hypothetical protein